MRGFHFNKFILLFLSSLTVLFIVACSPQEASSPIEFVGAITAINGDTLTVGGFSVDISNASIPTEGLTVGEEVRVTGLSQGTVIVAVVVVPMSSSEVDEEAQVTNTAPEGTDDAPVATDVPAEMTQGAETTPNSIPATNVPIVVADASPIIVIEGPVQEININSITIFDIDIQVNPADPILTQIRIGDTIRIEGQSSLEGTTIIIIAINITIIETTVIVINNPVYIPPGLPANCRVKKSGKVTCKNSRRS